MVADFNQRNLIDTGILVGAAELLQFINFNTGIGHIVVQRTNNDTVGIDGIDNTVIFGNDSCTGIFGHRCFHTGTDQRSFRTQQRHALALHVRTHQRTVRVIVFQERNQRSSDRNQLLRRNVDEIDFFRMSKFKFTGFAAGNQVIFKMAVIFNLGIGLGNFELAFFIGGQIDNFIGNHAVDNLAVRAFDKAVFVNAGIG